MLVLDTNGNRIADKKVGGKKTDYIKAVTYFDNGLLLSGSTLSDSFEEGTSEIKTENSLQAFITKLEYFPLQIESTEKESVEIYPNPAEQVVIIRMRRNAYQSLTIFNNTGQKLFEQEISKSETELRIDIGNWTRGIYSMILQNGNTREYRRLVVR